MQRPSHFSYLGKVPMQARNILEEKFLHSQANCGIGNAK